MPDCSAIPETGMRERPEPEQLTGIPELNDPKRRRLLQKGECLFEQGTHPTHLFYVHSGALKVSRCSGTGRDVITELLFPGDMCGALCSLDCRPYPVQATALIATEVTPLPREDFLRLSADHPQLMAYATGVCRSKMRSQREMMVGMVVERAEQRAARALLMLADRLGTRCGEGVQMPALLDRQEFSELIGTTIETAIRVLSKFRKQQWLKEGDGVITLQSVPELLRVADLN